MQVLLLKELRRGERSEAREAGRRRWRKGERREGASGTNIKHFSIQGRELSREYQWESYWRLQEAADSGLRPGRCSVAAVLAGEGGGEGREIG